MYYVYGHKEKGKDEYVYIGSGEGKRPYHVNQRTCDYHRDLMRNKELDVEIISSHGNKEDAFIQEKHLIVLHKPKLNKMVYFSGKKTDELTPLEIDLRKKERIAYYQELKNA